jgi:hypothetical protein
LQDSDVSQLYKLWGVFHNRPETPQALEMLRAVKEAVAWPGEHGEVAPATLQLVKDAIRQAQDRCSINVGRVWNSSSSLVTAGNLYEMEKSKCSISPNERLVK